MGITDVKRVYTSQDLASGEHIVFAATGVTDGPLMKGVRFFGDGIRTSSLVMQSNPARIRFIDTIHVEESKTVRVRFLTWQKNLFAVTAASFIGFTGFTLVMPFLPLYFQQLGVQDVGEIALWSGLSLGVTPALTALLSPFWGRLADRYGRKIMVERSLVSFVVVMAAMAYVTPAVARVRAARRAGLLRRLRRADADDGGRSAPRDRMASAIGIVQTAQRLGPALGPIIGGAVAQVVGLRRAFLVTAVFYACALVLVFCDVRRARRAPRAGHGRDGPHLVPQRPRVRELHPADGGDLRAAVRRSQLRPGPAAVRAAAGNSRCAECRSSPACCSRIAAGAGAIGHHVCGTAPAPCVRRGRVIASERRGGRRGRSGLRRRRRHRPALCRDADLRPGHRRLDDGRVHGGGQRDSGLGARRGIRPADDGVARRASR